MFDYKNLFGGLVSFAVIATVLPSGQIVAVPETAVSHSPALESVTFVHYRDGAVKPISSAKAGSPTCYTFISRDAKLTSVENVLVNPLNSGMMDADVLFQARSSAMTWDNATGKTIWGGFNLDYTAGFDSAADGLNEISFGAYGNPDVIAVTRIWGVFSGKTRYIDQFDVLFNTTFKWGDVATTGNTSLMDFPNIGTHELGHAVGLGDLYNTCVNETMYGYSNYGETKKRDLNTGDILGLQKLYGV